MNETEMQYALRMQSERLYEKGCEKLNIPVKDLKFDFSLRGNVAGQARYRDNQLRYNVPLAMKNFTTFMQDTVPHEVSHLLARSKYGTHIKPHGTEWKRVMVNVFGLIPKRTHSMETEPTRKQARYTYRCNCKVYELTATRHNKNKRYGGEIYSCPKCNGILKYTP